MNTIRSIIEMLRMQRWQCPIYLLNEVWAKSQIINHFTFSALLCTKWTIIATKKPEISIKKLYPLWNNFIMLINHRKAVLTSERLIYLFCVVIILNSNFRPSRIEVTSHHSHCGNSGMCEKFVWNKEWFVLNCWLRMKILLNDR